MLTVSLDTEIMYTFYLYMHSDRELESVDISIPVSLSFYLLQKKEAWLVITWDQIRKKGL